MKLLHDLAWALCVWPALSSMSETQPLAVNEAMCATAATAQACPCPGCPVTAADLAMPTACPQGCTRYCSGVPGCSTPHAHCGVGPQAPAAPATPQVFYNVAMQCPTPSQAAAALHEYTVKVRFPGRGQGSACPGITTLANTHAVMSWCNNVMHVRVQPAECGFARLCLKLSAPGKDGATHRYEGEQDVQLDTVTCMVLTAAGCPEPCSAEVVVTRRPVQPAPTPPVMQQVAGTSMPMPTPVPAVMPQRMMYPPAPPVMQQVAGTSMPTQRMMYPPVTPPVAMPMPMPAPGLPMLPPPLPPMPPMPSYAVMPLPAPVQFSTQVPMPVPMAMPEPVRIPTLAPAAPARVQLPTSVPAIRLVRARVSESGPVARATTISVVKEDGKSRLCMKGADGSCATCTSMKRQAGESGLLRIVAGKKTVHLHGQSWKAYADKVEMHPDGFVVLTGHVKVVSEKSGMTSSLKADRVALKVKQGKITTLVGGMIQN